MKPFGLLLATQPWGLVGDRGIVTDWTNTNQSHFFMKGKALEWTKEKPKTPGFYWAIKFDDSPEPVQITSFLDHRGRQIIYCLGDGQKWYLSEFEMWYGPIEAPPPQSTMGVPK